MIVETLDNILNSSLCQCDNLRYCLVDETKKPYKIDNTLARPNNENDFISLSDLINNLTSTEYKGVGISIQASKICAIDVDHCFKNPFDITSVDERGQDIINLFKGKTYIEFSFSGTGLRILFTHNIIDNYSIKYFIKNSKNNIEYYQPTSSYRYVTVTGKYIDNHIIDVVSDEILNTFLNNYMLKPEKKLKELNKIKEEKTIEQLLKDVRVLYIKNENFQEVWFSKAPGSGADESERDYKLLSMIYENITQDKDKVKEIFEHSPFFKSKDWKHVKKWNYGNFRYFEYVYSQIEGRYI